MFFVRYFLKLASALLSISGSLLFALPQVKCNLTRNFSVFFHFLPCGLVSNLGEGCADRAYTTIPCTFLTHCHAIQQWFLQKDFVPIRRIQQIVRLFEQRWSYPSSVWITSEHWNSVGVFHSLHSSPPSKTNIWRLLCCLSVFYHFKTLSSYGWSKL